MADQSHLDSQIYALTDKMNEIGVLDEKYPKLLADLNLLNEMKTKNRRPRISWDTVIIAGASILSTLIVVIVEKEISLSPKALAERPRMPGTHKSTN